MAASSDAYAKERQAVIATGNSLRFDAGTQAAATNLEKEANRLLLELRAQEHQSIWHVKDDAKVHRNMPFTQAKSISKNSRLSKLLKGMPKGALLHCHADASAPSEFLLQQAYRQPTLVIKASRPLGSEDLIEDRKHHKQPVAFSFGYSDQEENLTVHEVSLFDSKYNEEWVDVRKARENCKGGGKIFDGMVMAHLGLPAHSYHDTSERVWQHFSSYFSTASGLFHHPEILRSYIKETIRIAVQDNISYVELRKAFFDPSVPSFEQNFVEICRRDPLSPATQMQITESCIEEAKKEYGERFQGLRIIYVAIRFIKGMEVAAAPGFEWANDMQTYMKSCLDLKEKFPNLICAFDMAAHEDSGITLEKYIPDLLWFRNECEKRQRDIPFCFHAGETNADGGKIVENLVDAILLGTKRIGHGYAIATQPHLMEMCKQRNILIESCPISNEALRYTPSMMNHTLPILLNNGVCATLNNDDPACFQNQGLTFDFYHFFNNTHAFNLLSLKKMALDSISHSFMTAQEKGNAATFFEKQWNTYLQSILSALRA